MEVETTPKEQKQEGFNPYINNEGTVMGIFIIKQLEEKGFVLLLETLEHQWAIQS